MLNLNLLPSKAKFQAFKISLRQRIWLVITIVVAVWVIGLMVVTGLNIGVKYSLGKAESENKRVMENYLGLKSDIAMSQNLKYHAKTVGSILNQRFEYGDSIEMILALFPGGIQIKNNDLKADGLFEITATTQGKTNIDWLEKKIAEINAGTEPKLAWARLHSLSVESGIWSFMMEVKLK